MEENQQNKVFTFKSNTNNKKIQKNIENKEFIHPRVIIPFKNKRKEFLLEKKAIEEKKLKTNNNIDSLLIQSRGLLKEAIEKENNSFKKQQILNIIYNIDNITDKKNFNSLKINKEEEENKALKKDKLELREKINNLSNKIDKIGKSIEGGVIHSPGINNINTSTKTPLGPPSIEKAIEKDTTTWAKVVSKNTIKSNKINSKKELGNKTLENKNNYKNQRLVLITKNKSQPIDSYNLKEKINKNLKEKLQLKSNINIIISIIKNKNNNIIITVKEGYNPNILLENKDTWESSFIFNKAIKDRDYYSLIIHDINNKAYNNPLGLNKIKEDLENDNLGLSIIGYPKWISKKENRTNKEYSSIIISFNTEGEREKYLYKKIYLGGIQPRIEKFNPSYKERNINNINNNNTSND